MPSFKVILFVVIIALIAGGVWWYSSGQNQHDVYTSEQGDTGSSSQTAATISATNTSNEALDQDVLTINAQLNNLSNDSASIDQSFNDKPIAVQ
jgi:uncharacterized membrane protein affecting hemolysin expression